MSTPVVIAAPPTDTATRTPVHIIVPGDCQCRYCPLCLEDFTGQACAHCTNPGIPQTQCHGCITDACEHVGIIAQQWFHANPPTSERWTVIGGEGTVTPYSLLDVTPHPTTPTTQYWWIEPWPGGRLTVTVDDGATSPITLDVTP